MLPTTYQQFIHQSFYARWDEEKQRRETWEETVDRYMGFISQHLQKNLGFNLEDKYEQQLKKSILSLEVMPSMRALWSAGPAAERENASTYNCSYLAINRPQSFDEAFYLLMCGLGVGFSVERQFIKNLPIVAEEFYPTDSQIIVGDSKEGWASSLKELISLLYVGRIPRWDLSRVRPAGARLKTTGGRASGPLPLDDLFRFTVNLFLDAKGSRLTSIQCHDLMCKIASCVIVGGVRKGAMISFSNLSDQRMQKAKSGQWWETYPYRALSNNSVAYTETPDLNIFMNEWISLHESKSGERGIFNRQAARKKIESLGRRDPDHEWGANPCQPGWAPVITRGGIKQLKDIQVGDQVWSQFGWSMVTDKQVTGIKMVKRYRTTASVFYGTSEHRVIQYGERISVDDAESIDICRGPHFTSGLVANLKLDHQAIMDGTLIGDGSFHKTSNNLVYLFIGKNDKDYFESEISYLIKKYRPGLSENVYTVETQLTSNDLPHTYNRKVPQFYLYSSPDKTASFLRGLYSANGSVVNNRVTLKTSSANLSEDVQIMLSSLGIKSYMTTNAPHEVNLSNGRYLCKQSYDVNIASDINIFRDLIGFIQRYKMEKLELAINNKGPSYNHEKITFDIMSVECIGEEEVYDITVNNNDHTYWTGGCNVSNCNEIMLRDRQFCNLSQVTVRPNDDLVSLSDKIRTATILGTIQSTLTKFNYISKAWHDNTNEERLLGVGMTGILDNPIMAKPSKKLADLLTKLKEIAIETNKEWANKLGVPISAAITTIKPAGNSSQLTNTASGLHPRYSQYYIRTVRLSKLDSLAQMMSDYGVPYEDDIMNPKSTHVFSFPIESPSGSLLRSELSAIDHLELWKFYQDYYTEHKPSLTCSIRKKEWLHIAAWVYDHFDEISGVSFLPYSDHIYKQAPYQECTEEEYKETESKMPKVINWQKLSEYEKDDNTIGAQELACSNGSCEI